jgi:hypothetical protein
VIPQCAALALATAIVAAKPGKSIASATLSCVFGARSTVLSHKPIGYRASITRCAGCLGVCAERRDETATVIWFAPHSAHGRPGFHDPALIGV